MGEQPLFTCKAHVFQLEPEMRKSWIALSEAAVNVQIFHDPIKNIYRIVSVEGTKALINSIVTPRMTFAKTSQKFGQWIDFKLNLVYGLGFANDVELNKFVDKFKEIKELTRNLVFLRPHERSNSCEITSMNRTSTNSSIHVNHSSNNHNGIDLTDHSSNSDMNLKNENEKLKMALAQTSHANRKIEEEMQSYKNANLRLTNALHETQTSTDDFRKQLQFYKEECARLKRTVQRNGSTSTNRLENDMDEVSSSSTSLNKSSNALNSNQNSKLKQDIVKLAENFDIKLNEMTEIRDQLKKLIAEMQ